MTKTLYSATSKYVKEINNLPVKRQVSVSGILKKLGVSRSGYCFTFTPPEIQTLNNEIIKYIQFSLSDPVHT